MTVEEKILNNGKEAGQRSSYVIVFIIVASIYQNMHNKEQISENVHMNQFIMNFAIWKLSSFYFKKDFFRA